MCAALAMSDAALHPKKPKRKVHVDTGELPEMCGG
jgi:hypothetical protein